MQTRKTRHQFYLPDDLSARLAAMATEPGSSKTAILTDALTAWFERRAAHELDTRFAVGLDRQSRNAERMEEKLDFLTEALGLFVRHQLTMTAHQPAFDAQTQRLGRLRYDEFVKAAGRLAGRTVQVEPRPDRSLGRALRERIFFVRLRTMVKNRVVIDRALAFIDDINQHIRAAEKTIRRFSTDNAEVRRLKTMPGVGEFFARLIAAEIDDVSRFRSAKKLAAYAGLVPSTYASGGKCWNGRIIKAGNKWLRWAFVEAATPAVRAEPALKFEYERLKATKGANRAKVAVARKLLTIAYQMLRDQRDYERRDALERPSASSRLS